MSGKLPFLRPPRRNSHVRRVMEEGGENTKGVFSPPFFEEVDAFHPFSLSGVFFTLFAFFLTVKAYDWEMVGCLWLGTVIVPFWGCRNVRASSRRWLLVSPFLLIAFLLHVFYTPGRIVGHWGPFFATAEGVREGAWVAQKLAAYFWLSFLVTSNVDEFFFFQLLGRIRRLRLVRRCSLGLWMMALFLILRWLAVLPARWVRQVKGALKDVRGRYRKVLEGGRLLPVVLKEDVRRIHQWLDLFVLRGYAEGILWISETPFAPLSKKDRIVFFFLLVSWGGWLIYLL